MTTAQPRTRFSRNHTLPAVVGAFLGALCVSIIALLAGISGNLIAAPMVFGAIIGALAGVATNTVGTPLNFRDFVPKDPLPKTYDNTMASEDGSKVSSTVLAKICAVGFIVGIVALIWSSDFLSALGKTGVTNIGVPLG